MPLCRYGAHCQQPRCIYRHDEGASQRPCLAYLSGACDFGDRCWHWHPATATECEAVRRVLRRRPCTNPKPCPFGVRCLFLCEEGT